MSVCAPSNLHDTVDQCGNPVDLPPLPLTQNEQNRAQSPLNRARADKFLMIFDVPACIRQQTQKTFRECNQVSLDQMQFNIFGAPTPGVSLGVVSLPYVGHTAKAAQHSRTMEPLAVNYFVDNTYANYWVLWAWADFIISSLTSQVGGDVSTINQLVAKHKNVLLQDYSTNISIFALNAFNKPAIEWIYKGCILSSIGPMQYSYQSPTELQSTFTFEYSFLDCKLR